MAAPPDREINVEVKKILGKRPVARTAFQHIHVGVLKESCQLLDLAVSCSGKRVKKSIKCDYTEALVNYVGNHLPWAIVTRLSHISQGNSKADASIGEKMGVDIPDLMDMDVDVDATCAREEAISQGSIPQTKVVRIRLYKQPRDWNAVCELNFCCETNGEVNLDKVGKELGIEEACRVCSYLEWYNSANPDTQIIDPKTYKPFYLYNDAIINAADVADLTSQGFLRVVKNSDTKKRL
jgi:hypothetical protein